MESDIYKELLELGWKCFDSGEFYVFLRKEDKVIKIYNTMINTEEMEHKNVQDTYVYEYEPLLDLKHLPEVPKLFAYEMHSYLIMEYIQGYSLANCSSLEIKKMIPDIFSYYDKCCESGWIPTELSLDKLFWSNQKGLRVINFTTYKNVKKTAKQTKATILQYEKNVLLNRLQAEIDRRKAYQYA